MKLSTLIVVGSALLLFGVGTAAAAPGGDRPMGAGMPGATPGGMPGHAEMGRPADRQTGPQNEEHGVNDLLAADDKLSSQIKDLTGMDAKDACAGFKNLGSCMAAAHVSKNLQIPFDALRTKLTGSGAVSLGKAIHDLRPDADAKSAARDATRQASADLKHRG